MSDLTVDVASELLVDGDPVSTSNRLPVDAATGLTQPLTDAQLAARLPLPVSGTFADENGVPFSQANPLPVDVGASLELNNVTVEFDSPVSTVNSLNTPLDADAEFVGQWEEVKDYSGIAVAYLTDAASAVGGASIEFSTDGVNVDLSESSTVVADYGGFSVFQARARYFRVRYVNGPAPQTFVRSEVRYLFNPPTVGLAPLAAPTHDASVVQTSKAMLHGRLASGLSHPALIDADGHLKVDVVTGPATQTDALTDAELRAEPVETWLTGEITKATVTATGSGDITIVTPGAGQRVRLRKFSYSADGGNASGVVVALKFGANSPIDRQWLDPKQPYADGLTNRHVTGGVDEALKVNLSTAVSPGVYVNVAYELV